MSAPTMLRSALVVDAPTIHATHACRGCNHHDCAQQFDHERAVAASETEWRKTIRQRNVCPSCGGDVRDDGPCITAVAR